MPVPDSGPHRFTYTDYATWPDDERWEIIGGEAYAMTPAPSFAHQRIALRLAAALELALRGQTCVPAIAPVDVVLTEEDVVQPDVIVVCDRAKITPRGIAGPPDLVVEVLSPTSARMDRREKKTLYERSGVREYVLLDPDGRYAERYALGADGAYGKAEILAPGETLRFDSLQGLEVPLGEVFEGEPRDERPVPGAARPG